MLHEEEEEKHVRGAMKIFLLFAALIYTAALTYSFITKNALAEILLISGGALVTGIIIFLNRRDRK